MSLEHFTNDLDARIRQVSGQQGDNDMPELEFVSTLRNYVIGLVKHHGSNDTSVLHGLLREFLEDATTPFVRWCATLLCALHNARRQAWFTSPAPPGTAVTTHHVHHCKRDQAS